MDPLIEMLDSKFPLEPNCRIDIEDSLQSKILYTGTFWQRGGEPANKICWVESGILRTYIVDDEGKEHTTWIAMPGDIVVPVKPFFLQTPNDEWIVPIKETKVRFITYDKLEALYKKYVKFNINARLITLDYYAIAEDHRKIMHLPKTIRYQKFIEAFPKFKHSAIPDRYLANYLGMTETFFYKIRKKLEEEGLFQ